MSKPEWGTKRQCPKCGTRFYDLQNDDPVTCIECGNAWNPEPVLKSKQPVQFEEVQKKEVEERQDTDLAEEDLDIDEPSADLTGADIWPALQSLGNDTLGAWSIGQRATPPVNK